jgi:D-glycero-beta-D-manno-heptose 1-phosphate adenylyltransferase
MDNFTQTPDRWYTPVNKIVSQDALVEIVKVQKMKGHCVVFTNGCFDLLHLGHMRCLDQARKLGHMLVVAVNSDRSVREYKGPDRPLVPEADRAEMLAALAAVDHVTIFDEPTPRELIARVLPNVLVKGGDWTREQIAGHEEVEAHGGLVTTIPLTPGYSTTELLEKIRKARP